jgi:hypothetical protein
MAMVWRSRLSTSRPVPWVRHLHETHRVGCRTNRRQRIAQFVRNNGNKLILLAILLFQRLFCPFQFLTLVQFTQARQFFEKAFTHLASIGLRIFQQQAGEVLVSTHQ